MSRPSLSGLSTDLARRIDDRCDAFEAGWSRVPRRPLTAYLEGFDGDARLVLLRRLLRLDVELRCAAGQEPHPTDYLGHDGSVVRSAFREAMTAPHLPAAEAPPPEVDGREVLGLLGGGGF